jgi:HlyD family secretion protein
MSTKTKIIIGVVAVVFIAALIIVNLKQSSGKTLSVQTEEVKKGRLVHMVSGTGKIQPEIQVRISANVSARIIALHAIEGERVPKGKVLVELDRTRYEASVVQAQASLSSSQATARQQQASMDQAKSEFDRSQKLFKQGLASQGDQENAKTQYEVAKARYEAAQDQVTQSEAYLEQAKDDLAKTTIASPIDGVITLLNKEEGEIALGSQFQEDVIMIVSDLSNMEAVVEIDENDVVNISLGDSAKISVDAFPDTVFIGIVSEIAHSAKAKGLGTQEEVINFDVKVAVIDKIGNIRPGMSSNVDIVTDIREQAIKVPIQCVTVRTNGEIADYLNPRKGRRSRRSDSESDSTKTNLNEKDEEELQEVIFIVEENVAKVRKVKTGITGETEIEILDGVKEGETVITGSYRILSKEIKHDSQIKVEKSKRFQSRTEESE